MQDGDEEASQLRQSDNHISHLFNLLKSWYITERISELKLVCGCPRQNDVEVHTSNKGQYRAIQYKLNCCDEPNVIIVIDGGLLLTCVHIF